MPDNWFVCPQPNLRVESRLFLFPYAGGGPAAFGKWPSTAPRTIETWIAHYPGRGSRHNEPPIKRVQLLAEALAQAIQPLLDKPFAFLGHSLGGLVAFELSRMLQQQNLPPPQLLSISACGAPHLPDPHPPLHALPDLEFLQVLRELNGTPSGAMKDPEVMHLLLPALRADFEALEMYVDERNNLPLHCPVLAFGGLDDSRVSRERLEGWASHTDASFQSVYFSGDHFFINTAREAIIEAIAGQLIPSPAKQ